MYLHTSICFNSNWFYFQILEGLLQMLDPIPNLWEIFTWLSSNFHFLIWYQSFYNKILARNRIIWYLKEQLISSLVIIYSIMSLAIFLTLKIVDSCIDVWTGNDLEPMGEDVRRKILDFYQRASLSSYCTAFSYRPLILPLPWTSMVEYLQLPSHSLPFYSYCAGTTNAEADAVQSGHISLGENNL